MQQFRVTLSVICWTNVWRPGYWSETGLLIFWQKLLHDELLCKHQHWKATLKANNFGSIPMDLRQLVHCVCNYNISIACELKTLQINWYIWLEHWYFCIIILAVMVIFAVDDKIYFYSQKEPCNLILMMLITIITCINNEIKYWWLERM